MGTYMFVGMFKHLNITWYCYLFIFYIFSDARSMAKDVHNIIVKVVMENGQMTSSQALNYVKKMEQQKRYSADVWS